VVFWATICTTVRLRCLCVSLSLSCHVGVLWPNGWMDQNATWYRVRPRFRRHCVRRGSSSPTPERDGPCLLWPHGRPSQQLLSSCFRCSSGQTDRQTDRHASRNTDDRQVTLVALLDLSSAFDCVDHELLLRRLQYNFRFTDDVPRCRAYVGSALRQTFPRRPRNVRVISVQHDLGNPSHRTAGPKPEKASIIAFACPVTVA